ncbi:MAG: hypothetical protein HZC48_11940 [Nitrospirae bacterium]|nr:hypothetical protein [Nitrospirota bacterium]
MVKGAVINLTGNETGVTVNGIVAAVYGTRFIANNVPLTEGSNTITVTATDTVSSPATSSITVNAVTTGNYIKLSSNIDSGIAPLELTLKIDASFSIDNSSINITGPSEAEFLPSSNDEYKVKIKAEGIYYVTASVTGPDSIVYQDTIAITVLNKDQLNIMLKGKWDGMKGALENQDVEGAVALFLSSSQERYRDIFSAITDQLPGIAANMNAIEIIYAEEGIAQYRIKRTEDVGEVTYYIYFAIDENGLWKIQQF